MRRRRDLVEERMARVEAALQSRDPGTTMLRALACHLHGESYESPRPLARVPSPALELGSRALEGLPRRARENVHALLAFGEAITVDELLALDAEDVATWTVSRYPRRTYSAVAIGAASGALMHLCAAMGIPWLPQTFLVPVRTRGLDVDDARRPLEWARQPARRVLAKNPELELHHVRDPNAERLLFEDTTHFCFKRVALGEAYTRFLEEQLEPGATIFVFDCRRTWPVTVVEERHVYQLGAPGGLDEREYVNGSSRVARFLSRYHRTREKWDPPEADRRAPDGAWGFSPALLPELEALARRSGFELVRVVFDEPEDPSALVADLYRAWYRANGLPGAQLLVESGALVAPRSTIRTASVPFWMKANDEPAFERLMRYLDGVEPYDYLLLALLAHGVDAVGLIPVAEWRGVLERARVRGRFLGMSPRHFPRGLGSHARFARALARIHPRFPLPPPLTREGLARFLASEGWRYPVRFERLEERGVSPSAEARP